MFVARAIPGLLVALCAPPKSRRSLQAGGLARAPGHELGLVATVQAAAAVVGSTRRTCRTPQSARSRPPVRGRHVLPGRLRRGQDARASPAAPMRTASGDVRPSSKNAAGLESDSPDVWRARAVRARRPRESPPLRTGPKEFTKNIEFFSRLRWPCVGGASSQIERRARDGVGPGSRRTSRAPRVGSCDLDLGPERQPLGAHDAVALDRGR